MTQQELPAFLHDVFGERPERIDLVALPAFGLAASWVFSMELGGATLPLWRHILALLLVADIFAGSLANLTRATSNYYAARPRSRWGFIGIHFHGIALAWLLHASLWHATLVWAVTVAFAVCVNLLHSSRRQLFIAGALTICGELVISSLALPWLWSATYQVFLFKVVFSFAVDHYRAERIAERPMRQGLHPLGAMDKPEAVRLLALAFERDPLFLWLFDSPDWGAKKAEALPKRFVSFVYDLVRISEGTPFGFFEQGRLVGVCLLEPPSKNAWRGFIASVGSLLRVLPLVPGLGLKRVGALNRYFVATRSTGSSEAYHYLTMVGVRKEHRGAGLGRQIVAAVIQAVETQPLSSGLALDTENAENLKFYADLGFVLRREEKLDGMTVHCLFRSKNSSLETPGSGT